jgi:RNA ligase (TIGR02306 family)
MRLATIETIANILPHPNADRLEIAQVLGWQTVVQSNLHKKGNKVVFIVVDTLLPNQPWSEFLLDKKDSTKPIRIKLIKLRGIPSAGIILPLSVFPELENLSVGTDVTDALNIKKYVKELPVELSGENIGTFPTYIASKTDEDNGLSNLDIVQEVIKFPSVTITQKLDGSSITIVVQNGQIEHVCSRKLSKKDSESSVFWKVARKISYLEGFSGVIQGELVGPKIQNNPLHLEDHEIYVFQIKKNSGEYMSYQQMKGFCNVELKCNVVPLVSECSFVGCDVQTALDKLQALADQQTYFSGNIAEGIVVRPTTYIKSSSSGRPFGFKILNRHYLD